MTLKLCLWKHKQPTMSAMLTQRHYAAIAYAWASVSADPCPPAGTNIGLRLGYLQVDGSRVADIGPFYEKLREFDPDLPAEPILVYSFDADQNVDGQKRAEQIGTAAGRCGFPKMPEFDFTNFPDRATIEIIVPTPEHAVKFRLFWDATGSAA